MTQPLILLIPKSRLGIVLAVLLLVGLAISARSLLGFRTVLPGETLGMDPGSAPWQQLFASVLKASVLEGRVDYDALLEKETDLRRYVAGLETFGPSSVPEAFSTQEASLAYYINAYNALVLLGVVANWPISSVHDVRGPLSPVPGFGFFYGLHFTLDGHRTNLYDLEKDILRARFQDARVHAAINCASGSCPDLAATPYEPGHLEAQLNQATRAFCSQPRHVRVDDEGRVILLSAIFDWFHEDFETHAARKGVGSSALDFIQHFAEPSVAAAVAEGRRRGYEVRFAAYDWQLNEVGRE